MSKQFTELLKDKDTRSVKLTPAATNQNGLIIMSYCHIVCSESKHDYLSFSIDDVQIISSPEP